MYYKLTSKRINIDNGRHIKQNEMEFEVTELKHTSRERRHELLVKYAFSGNFQ